MRPDNSQSSPQFRYYFWIFTALLVIISAADYIDHVSRENTSQFRDHWASWLAFTVMSTIVVAVMIALVHRLVGPRQGLLRVGADLAAGALAFVVHVSVTGPLIDQVFWTGNMTFPSPTLGLMAPLPILLVISMVIEKCCQLGSKWLKRKPVSPPSAELQPHQSSA